MGYVASMGRFRNAYKIFVSKFAYGRMIRMDSILNWIQVTQEKFQRRAFGRKKSARTIKFS
jgi:hypothetical protein